MSPCRQMIMWSVPSIAVLLGIFWFRKKRDSKSDPGGSERIKNLREELAEALKTEAEAVKSSPMGKAERAVIKSAPIDIVPNGISSQKSSPLQLTDEEVDLEIEKIIRKKSLEKEKKSIPNIETKNDLKLIETKTLFSEVSASTSNTGQTNEAITMETSHNSQNSTHEVIENNSINGSNDIEINNQTDRASVEDKNDDKELDDNVENEPSNNNVSNSNEFDAQQSRRISERDSANHSPMDHILASPSMCHFSDNHSEVRLFVVFDLKNNDIKNSHDPPTNFQAWQAIIYFQT